MLDSLAVLSVTNDARTAVSAVWHHFVDLDAAELRLSRDRMKIRLARYGRQPLDHWDDLPVTELVRWYELLKEVIDGENEASSVVEE